MDNGCHSIIGEVKDTAYSLLSIDRLKNIQVSVASIKGVEIESKIEIVKSSYNLLNTNVNNLKNRLISIKINRMYYTLLFS